MDLVQYRWLFILFAVGGVGLAAYQIKTKTFSRKGFGQKTSTTVGRSDARVMWFISTVGWLLLGLIGLVLAVAPSFG